MSSTTSSIAEEIENGIAELIQTVTQSEASSADRMERHIWWGLLAIGRQLMQLFFEVHNQAEEPVRTVEHEGQTYSYRGQRDRKYVSVFGQVRVERRYYWECGQGSVCPLDEALSLPAGIHSHMVQELIGAASVHQAYEEAVEQVTCWLPIDVSKGASQKMVADHGEMVTAYYEQAPVAEPPATDTILVVSADGKGVPMNREHSPPPAARRGKGRGIL